MMTTNSVVGHGTAFSLAVAIPCPMVQTSIAASSPRKMRVDAPEIAAISVLLFRFGIYASPSPWQVVGRLVRRGKNGNR